MKRLGRRSFLELCGGSAALAWWLKQAVARAQGADLPKRLMILHRPNGSIAEDWIRGGQPGPILEPFASVWPYAVALQGVDVRPANDPPQGHESGMVTLMTGAPLGPTQRTNDDYRSTARSLDQTLLEQSAALGPAPVPSLQLAAHGSQDGGNEVPNTALSYSGPAMPLYPTLRPADAYRRLFGDSLMPGGDTAGNGQALQAARLRRQSVLDFIRWDLTRVRGQFPADARAELDAHTEAVRELERGLDAGGDSDPATCGATGTPDASLDGMTGDYLQMERVGNAQLALVTAAFRCDLTRVVTFMWATGASLVAFPEFDTNNHHSTSHNDERVKLSAIDRWFSERTAPFIQSLVDTPDTGGGALIDNTLVWYVSEVAEGWNHSHTDYPFVVFGGDGVGLADRGRVLDVSGQGRTANDVWSSIARRLGTTLDGFDTDFTEPFF